MNESCFSPDGEFIATASGDTTVKLWRVSSGQCVITFSEHTRQVHDDTSLNALILTQVRSCCFSSDGKLIASASLDETIRLWNIESRKCIKTLKDNTRVFT